MATLTLSSITIPASSAYNALTPSKNNENFFAVMLDLLAEAKTVGFSVSDQDLSGLPAKFDALIESINSFSASVLAIADLHEY